MRRGTLLQGSTRAALAIPAAALVVVLAGLPALASMLGSFQERHTQPLGDGLEQTTYVRRGPDQVVHVARVKRGAPYELRAVPAMDGIGKGLERTSSICKRVGCAVAVNGDFWKPGTDVPIGGVVSRGHLLRAPVRDHAQFVLSSEGGLLTGGFHVAATLIPDDLDPIRIDAVDRPATTDRLVLLTPAHGRSTRAPEGTVELALRAMKPQGAVALDKTTLVRLAGKASARGNTMVPSDGAVLSGTGRGADAIRDLMARVEKGKTSREVLLRIRSNPSASESIGGSPVLVSKGSVVAPNDATSFVRGKHPRTIIGWTKEGEILLVTVDGRQPGYSEGMTIGEAAALMADLGAVDAMNLDGGGSTTFVKEGHVVNRPSDRAVRTPEGQHIVHMTDEGRHVIGNVERPVAIALAVVPRDAPAAAPPPQVLDDLPIPDTIELAAPHASDVASDPSGALPAVVRYAGGRSMTLEAVAFSSLVLALAIAAASSGYARGVAVGSGPLRRRRRGAARPTARRI